MNSVRRIRSLYECAERFLLVHIPIAGRLIAARNAAFRGEKDGRPSNARPYGETPLLPCRAARARDQ